MKLSMILSHTDVTVGIDGKLPWHMSADLARFKFLTDGHTVIMGRKCYESNGRPLPGCKEIVVTRNPDYKVREGVQVAGSLYSAIQKAEAAGETEAFVIGGATIFDQAIGIVDRVYVTVVKASHLPDGEQACISERTLEYITPGSPWFRKSGEESVRKNMLNAFDAHFFTLDRLLPCNYGDIYGGNLVFNSEFRVEIRSRKPAWVKDDIWERPWVSDPYPVPVRFDGHIVGYVTHIKKMVDEALGGVHRVTGLFSFFRNDAAYTMKQMTDGGLELAIAESEGKNEFEVVYNKYRSMTPLL